MNKVKFRTHIDSWMSFDCGREIHFSFKKRHGQRLGQPSRVTRFAFHLCPNSVCRQHPKRRCWGSWAMACCMEVWSSWGRGAAKPTRFGSTEWRKSPFFFNLFIIPNDGSTSPNPSFWGWSFLGVDTIFHGHDYWIKKDREKDVFLAGVLQIDSGIGFFMFFHHLPFQQ